MVIAHLCMKTKKIKDIKWQVTRCLFYIRRYHAFMHNGNCIMGTDYFTWLIKVQKKPKTHIRGGSRAAATPKVELLFVYAEILLLSIQDSCFASRVPQYLTDFFHIFW